MNAFSFLLEFYALLNRSRNDTKVTVQNRPENSLVQNYTQKTQEKKKTRVLQKLYKKPTFIECIVLYFID